VSLSRRQKWYLRYYWILPLAFLSLGIAILGRNPLTIFTSAMLIVLIVIGERGARSAYQWGRSQGVTDTLGAMGQAEGPDEFVRMIDHPTEPWHSTAMLKRDAPEAPQ